MIQQKRLLFPAFIKVKEKEEKDYLFLLVENDTWEDTVKYSYSNRLSDCFAYVLRLHPTPWVFPINPMLNS